MAKKAEKEVTEAEAVEVIQDENELLDQQIKSELKKYNLADAKIAELKKRYSGLKVRDLKDKEGFVAVKSALSEIVSFRTGIDKKRLALTADYRKITDSINGEAKRLVALLQEVEAPLREEKDRVEALLKEEKERKAREIQERLDARVNQLQESGMTFNGQYYVCGDTISMDINTIRDMKDTDFEFLNAKVIMEAERIRKEREEEEKRKAEEEAERKRQQEELERQQAELRKQQEEMEAQRKEFERQQQELAEMKLKAERDEQERKERIAQEEAAKHRRELQELVNKRASELERLNYYYSNSRKAYIFANRAGDHFVDEALLRTASEEYWPTIIAEVTAKADELKAEEAKIIETEKEAERKRILKEQEEAKAKAEEEEAARLAALPDVEKVESYISSLLLTDIPDVENDDIKEELLQFSAKMKHHASDLITYISKYSQVNSGE